MCYFKNYLLHTDDVSIFQPLVVGRYEIQLRAGANYSSTPKQDALNISNYVEFDVLLFKDRQELDISELDYFKDIEGLRYLSKYFNKNRGEYLPQHLIQELYRYLKQNTESCCGSCKERKNNE